MNVEQLKIMLTTLRRRYLLVVSCIILSLVLAISYCLATPNIFEATTTLLIDNGETLIANDLSLPSRFTNDINTQVQILKSDVIINGALSALYELGPEHIGPALVGLSHEKRVKELKKKLLVSFPRRTRLVQVAYRSEDPSSAATLVGCVADSYVNFIRDNRRSTATESLETLIKKRDEQERELHACETEILGLREKMGVILSNDVSTNQYERQIEILEKAIGEAKLERMQAEAAYRELVQHRSHPENIDLSFWLRKYTGDLSQSYMAGKMGVPTDYIWLWEQKERSSLELDEAELEHLATIYGPNHPNYVGPRNKIEIRRKSLENPDRYLREASEVESRRINDFVLSTSNQELIAAHATEEELEGQLLKVKEEAGKQSPQIIHLSMLETQVEQLKAFHDVLMQRIKELNLSGDMAQMKVCIVGPPTLPKDPVWPSIPKVLVLGLLGGLIGGSSLALLVDRFNNDFRGPEDVQEQLDIPVLANIPTFGSRIGCKPELIVSEAARSPEAEAFRSMRTGMFFQQDTRVFSMTSPYQGDGKSTILANLAIALVQAGKSTLVLDCDLRRPRQRAIWDLPLSKGLVHLLKLDEVSDDSIAAEVLTSQIENLDVLPVGPTPSNPSELLEKPGLMDILNWAKENYDYVLIDCPPVLPVTDASIIGRLVDGVLLVIRVNMDGRAGAIRAKSTLALVGTNILGAVVNGIDHKSSYGYYYYRKEAYQTSYESTAEEDSQAEPVHALNLEGSILPSGKLFPESARTDFENRASA